MSNALTLYRIKALNAYHALGERDRMALILLSIFFGVLILLYGMLLPAMDYRHQGRDAYDREQELLTWLQAQQPAVERLRTQPKAAQQASSTANSSPLTLVNTSAKEFQLTIKRLQPENNGSLRVWMENVSFDNSLKWLHHLQNNGLAVSDISIDEQSTGLVNLRATFGG